MQRVFPIIFILTFAKNIPLIRLTENNDWVIFILLASVLVFVIVLKYLQRQAGLREFFVQNFIDSGNIFPTWLIISSIYIVLLSTLISQYTLIPRYIEEISLLDLSLNKFGFTFLAISLFYFVKFMGSFFFYSSIGQDKKWGRLYFVSSKFYFAVSLLLIAGILINYYFDIDKEKFLQIIILTSLFIFIFKLLFYGFNKNYILPDEWYYKILYICTLQFAPLLALWKLLFF